jgi:branched-subunit amino acid ABC-type transport system permease component
MFAALIVGGVTNIIWSHSRRGSDRPGGSLTVQYFAAEYRQAVSFIAVILVLLVRPQGLVGERP